MTFAAWWARKYAHTGEVPEQYFDLMRDAYNCGKDDEREACAKVCGEPVRKPGGGFRVMIAPECAEAIRMRSNEPPPAP